MKYVDVPQSAGDWLKARDYLGFASEVLITDVTWEDCKDFDTQEDIQKLGLHVDHPKLIGIILLSPSNQRALQAKWDDTQDYADWEGRKIFLNTREYPNGHPGWITVPLDHDPQLELDFDDDVPPLSEAEAKAMKKKRKAEKKARKAAKKAGA